MRKSHLTESKALAMSSFKCRQPREKSRLSLRAGKAVCSDHVSNRGDHQGGSFRSRRPKDVQEVRHSKVTNIFRNWSFSRRAFSAAKLSDVG